MAEKETSKKLYWFLGLLTILVLAGLVFGILSFVKLVQHKKPDIYIITHRTTSGTLGEEKAEAQEWNARKFNHISASTQDVSEDRLMSGDITLSATNPEQITIKKGTYVVQASAPAFRSDVHQIRLYDETNKQVLAYGTSEHNHENVDGAAITRSLLHTIIKLDSDTVVKLEHFINNIGQEDHSLGTPTGSSSPEIYALLHLMKIE